MPAMPPVNMPVLPEVAVQPDNILDALHTIEQRCLWMASQLLSHWVPAESYVTWAQDDFDQGHERGWSNALSNAKRAVCRRIDQLIFESNMDGLLDRPFPEKMAALKEVGHPALEVVHELVIDPRNRQEHNYCPVDLSDARKAIQLADLFVRATAPDSTWSLQGRPVLFGSELLTGLSGGGKSGTAFWVCELPTNPLLFLDVFGKSRVVRVLNYRRCEMLTAPMDAFRPADSIKLGRWCCVAAVKKAATNAFSSGMFQIIKQTLQIADT